VTGLGLLTPDLSGKSLEMLLEILPKASRVMVLMNPDNPVSAIFWHETQAAAHKVGVDLQRRDVRKPAEIEPTFGAITAAAADALIVFDDPMLWSNRARIVALAAARKLPAMYGLREFADEGGLMSYGPDRPDQYRRTAIYVDKILKGTNPADLPVEQPASSNLLSISRPQKRLGSTCRLRSYCVRTS
jgi:putative ABC transport system substrate-binding protein